MGIAKRSQGTFPEAGARLVSLEGLADEIMALYDHPNRADGHIIAGRVTATALVAVAERLDGILSMLRSLGQRGKV